MLHGVVRNYLVISLVINNACRSGNIEGIAVTNFIGAKEENVGRSCVLHANCKYKPETV